MKGFFHLISSEQFTALFDAFSRLDRQTIELDEGLDRHLADDILAPEPLPPFSRSTMDGFALRARDSFGCGESEPALLEVCGEIAMGASSSALSLRPGHCARIWTGGELPRGADAVAMLEYTNPIDETTIELFRAVAPGENVIAVGDDFKQDARVLAGGHRLRPQDLGVLAGLGIHRVEVVQRPRVAIISTGDELVEPGKRPGPGQIRDINGTTLSALVREAGGAPLPLGIVGDSFEALLAACRAALREKIDILLVSGGSSVGKRDFTLAVFEQLDESELLAHGVSIRPGKPTIFARSGGTALFGLPGHVASAMVVFYLFVRPLLLRMCGAADTSLRRVPALTGEQLPSVIGREEYVRVRLAYGAGVLPVAWPVYGKSGLLKPLVAADGLLVIDRDCEGIDRGEQAEVLLFP